MKIAVVGAGGHGYNLVLMLAHLGVGSITVVDDDTIEITNLKKLY